MGKVFLSHTKKDRAVEALVSFLSDTLKRMNINRFVEYESILPATFWEDEIEENCGYCDVFVFFLSQKFFDRHWCMRELDIALSIKKRVLPVLCDYQRPSLVD